LEGAAEANVTVQVAVPAAVKVDGEQVKPDRPEAATRLTTVVRETPFNVAVTVTA
jgi:hypothetical protein